LKKVGALGAYEVTCVVLRIVQARIAELEEELEAERAARTKVTRCQTLSKQLYCIVEAHFCSY